jgi:integrase
MRSCEIKGLRWQDIDFMQKTLTVRRSKTHAGKRVIPLNADAWAATEELYTRAQNFDGTQSSHFVFPACENGLFEPTQPQKSWRSAWRSLKKAAGLSSIRFHDLRHHAITELAESQVSDQVIMSIAGHVSQEMLEHYSHVRIEAKRQAVNALSRPKAPLTGQSYGTNHATQQPLEASITALIPRKDWSGREDLNLRPPGPEKTNELVSH